MQRAMLPIALALALGPVTIACSAVAASGPEVLATVRIAQPVIAGGTLLPAGSYDIRLARDGPAPLPGQSATAQRWVEFVARDVVLARDVAEVLYDADATPVGASSVPAREGTSVVTLKGGEFLRISVKRAAERYLIHLPVAR